MHARRCSFWPPVHATPIPRSLLARRAVTRRNQIPGRPREGRGGSAGPSGAVARIRDDSSPDDDDKDDGGGSDDGGDVCRLKNWNSNLLEVELFYIVLCFFESFVFSNCLFFPIFWFSQSSVLLEWKCANVFVFLSTYLVLIFFFIEVSDTSSSDVMFGFRYTDVSIFSSHIIPAFPVEKTPRKNRYRKKLNQNYERAKKHKKNSAAWTPQPVLLRGPHISSAPFLFGFTDCRLREHAQLVDGLYDDPDIPTLLNKHRDLLISYNAAAERRSDALRPHRPEENWWAKRISIGEARKDSELDPSPLDTFQMLHPTEECIQAWNRLKDASFGFADCRQHNRASVQSYLIIVMTVGFLRTLSRFCFESLLRQIFKFYTSGRNSPERLERNSSRGWTG